MQTGYYLVTPDGDRRFISHTVNVRALEKLCDRHLSEKTGWDYWIDYLHGIDVNGALAWSNLDQTDRFI